MQVSHNFRATSAVFEDDHLVTCAGLVPVMSLATQTGLPELLGDKICIPAPRIKSGSAIPAPKLATLIAGMCAGADGIDDLDVVRCGGMKTLFDAVYAPSTIGTVLRELHGRHDYCRRSTRRTDELRCSSEPDLHYPGERQLRLA